MISVDNKLIDRLVKDFPPETTVEQMIFIAYTGKLNVDKEIALMKDFPMYRFYFICKGYEE